VRGLVIENYAPPLQKGVIRLGNGAYQWLVEDNEVRYNSGVGIAAGRGWVVRGNHVHHQGQLGVSGSDDDILVEGNEIAFNNTAGIDSHWEAGGSKFVHSRNLVLRNNYVHNNQGPGLWADGNNIYTIYEGNRVINNYGPGIDHEISYDAVIRNNLVEGNGFGWTAWVDGAGILINSSPNVEVYGNTVRNNNDGIGGIQSAQGSGNYGAYQLRNLWVHGNTIVMSVGLTGIVRQGGLTDPVFSSGWNNRFDYNTYTLGSANQYYAWDPWYMTTAQWRAAGQDAHSTWTNSTPGTTTTTVPGTNPPPTVRRPSAPWAVRPLPASGAVTVRWAAPAESGGATIQDYLIQYRRVGATGWSTVQDGVSTARRATVGSLTNGAPYQFRVAAGNTAGVGLWSPPVRIRAGVPTRPRSLTASAGAGEVVLAWRPPAADNGAGLTNYMVQFRRLGARTWTTFRDGVSVALDTRVTRLANGTLYEFRVAAKNSRGVGAWSAAIRAQPHL
jgi:parallel beta-helix repeat protein